MKAMRAKERAQNVVDDYPSGRMELPVREAGLVCSPESTLASWGCDRGWRAGAMLRSRSTQEMDGPYHYRGPHPAHCAAWISVGPMVAIKWGLHTRNHTLEDPHTGELVDGDS